MKTKSTKHKSPQENHPEDLENPTNLYFERFTGRAIKPLALMTDGLITPYGSITNYPSVPSGF
jgi:hypothetical protein